MEVSNWIPLATYIFAVAFARRRDVDNGCIVKNEGVRKTWLYIPKKITH
jgi:hypothetical protein